MTVHESMLINTDRNFNDRIKMGNRQLVKAIGKVTIVIKTRRGKRFIKEVICWYLALMKTS